MAIATGAIIYMDMSFTLNMFKERQLDQALESRPLSGYFGKVISVHPLAGLFETADDRFGTPKVTALNDMHLFFTNSGSWGNISGIVRRQTGTRERENGQIVRCNTAWGG